jgi:hypothetical protein
MQIYFSDSTLPDFNYPFNQSKFYIISPVTPVTTTLAECPIMTNNDKNYLHQFSSDSYLFVCQYLTADPEKANGDAAGVSAGERQKASQCANFFSGGPYPDNERLRHSRELILSGYSKIVNGDLNGGISDHKEGYKILNNFSTSVALCTGSG